MSGIAAPPLTVRRAMEALVRRPRSSVLLRPSVHLFEADGVTPPCVECAHDRSWHWKAGDGCVGISHAGCRCPGYVGPAATEAT